MAKNSSDDSEILRRHSKLRNEESFSVLDQGASMYSLWVDPERVLAKLKCLVCETMLLSDKERARLQDELARIDPIRRLRLLQLLEKEKIEK